MKLRNLGLCLCGIFAMCGSATLLAVASERYNFTPVAAAAALPGSTSFETDFTVAAEKTVNAVVCIKRYTAPKRNQGYGNGGMDPFDMFEFFFGVPQQRQQPQNRNQQGNKDGNLQPNGLGSGVIISEDGYIVTNNHVVADADRLEVLLNDNSTYDARIVGTDEATDLALIKIDATGLSPIQFGNSDNLKVGEWVLAVGNPFGFNSTVTAGIVSAKARSLGHNSGMSIESFIQTDAALNPGNSGGALVNLKGELVGINSAIYSNTGSYTGFSFAIPTTIVRKVMNDIQQFGTVQRAVLGITIVELDAKLAKEKDITATKTGLVVTSVNDRSAAKEIGLEVDDVITAVNGVEVLNFAQLNEQMSKFRPGDSIAITFVRDNKKQTRSGTLRNTQGNTTLSKKGDLADAGCAFMKISKETMTSLGISNGVQVTGLKPGPFKDAGLRDGFIILTVNERPVSSPEDMETIYDALMKSDAERVMFISGIYPTGKRGYYAVNLNQE